MPEEMKYEKFKQKYLTNDQKNVKSNEGNIKARLEARFKQTNFKFEALSYPPKEIDIMKLRLDEAHIKAREHGIDETTAKDYIQKALFTISRWNGKFEQYYSYEGAAYVLGNSLIRTAFSAKEYDDKLKRILEICKEEIR